jgi:hypothetical protein
MRFFITVSDRLNGPRNYSSIIFYPISTKATSTIYAKIISLCVNRMNFPGNKRK